jgi:chromosome segregation ATPase
MVKTSSDVMDITPQESMEQLEDIASEKKKTIAAKKKEYEELEKQKKKEIEDLEKKKKKEIDDLENTKKKELGELDKKKKELEDLEKKKTQEIEETQDLIEKRFQDLMRHKRKIIQDEQDLESVAKTAPATTPQHVNYGRVFDELKTPNRVYEAANKNFYTNLTDLRDRAARGDITPQEEEFVERLRTRFETFERDTEYIGNADRNNYIKRSLNIIGQIDDYRIRR